MIALMAVPSSNAAAPNSEVRELGFVPPHDLDAEAAVLSAVLLDGKALGRVEDFLLPIHFYSEAHRRIYEAALEVKATGSVVDELTVTARLKQLGRLAQVGGVGYVSEVLASSPVVANVRDHAAIVFERWRVRQTMQICDRAAIYGRGVVDAQAYIDSVTRNLAELARQTPGSKIERNFEVLRRLVRQMHEGERAAPESARSRGIPTGIRSYDELTLGLFAGQKTTVVAPARVGKSAFGLQIATNVARHRMTVGFWSTEMTRDEVGVRQLASAASIDSRRIEQQMQRPTFTSDEWRRVSMASAELEELKLALHVYDDPSPTIDDVCAQAKALHDQALAVDGTPLGLIVVDYVQRLRPARILQGKPLHEQVRYATERLKVLASELKVPVVELAQSKNNEVDKLKGCRPRPQLGDAADSIQIERSANNVVHLWRPRERDGSHVKAVLVKQRGGNEGEIDLRFEKALSRFEDMPHGPMTSPGRQYADHDEEG